MTENIRVVIQHFRNTGQLYCPKCQTFKDPTNPDDGFASSKRRRTGYQLWCRSCQQQYDRELYRKPKRKAAIALANRRRAAENSVLVFAYLVHNPCVDCGQRDPVLLEFDHRDEVEKVSSISDMIRGGQAGQLLVDRCHN